MKKLHTLFVIAVALCTVTANAQIYKGAILLGGNIGGSTETVKSDGGTSKYNFINISPVFGKAIRENLVFGVSTAFTFSKNKSESSSFEQTQKGSSYGAGIFLRKYRTIGKSGFYLFIQGDFNGGFGHSTNQTTTIKTESNGYSVSLSSYPGLSYAVSRRLQLETGFSNLVNLTYRHQKSTNTPTGSTPTSSTLSGFNFSTSLSNFGSSLYLGFRVLLNKA